MRELATQALHAARREDWDAVKQSFADISADGKAVTFALMAWCDTTIKAGADLMGQPSPDAGEVAEPVAEIVRPAWIHAETGRVTLDADEMTPEARWAGRLVAARAAMDEVQWQVLVGTLPGDGFVRGQYVLALLRGCAGLVGLAEAKGGAS